MALAKTFSFENSYIVYVNHSLVSIFANEFTYFSCVTVSLGEFQWMGLDISGGPKNTILSLSKCLLNFCASWRSYFSCELSFDKTLSQNCSATAKHWFESKERSHSKADLMKHHYYKWYIIFWCFSFVNTKHCLLISFKYKIHARMAKPSID